MKQWVTIFLLIWATATLAAAGEHQPHRGTAECHATLLSPQHQPDIDTEQAPLLATASTAPRQLIGAEQPLLRTNRTSNEYTPDAIHAHGCAPHFRVLEMAATGHTVSIAGILSPDRYIYYLRKIII